MLTKDWWTEEVFTFGKLAPRLKKVQLLLIREHVKNVTVAPALTLDFAEVFHQNTELVMSTAGEMLRLFSK